MLVASRAGNVFALRGLLNGRRLISTTSNNAPLAFAFDIDGVLCHGHHAIPAAKRALNYLRGNNPLKLDIPFVLEDIQITNGGGTSEEERASRLSDILSHPIEAAQLIQSHTVLKSIAHKYQDEAVLVLGGKPGIENVAKSYGFRNVYTSYHILDSNPGIWPFTSRNIQYSLAKQESLTDLDIRAVIVFHDPRDWGRDIQLMLDVLTRTESRAEVIFCNNDLLWKSNYPRPRLGQGGFINAFQGVYAAVTGSSCPAIYYGKPSKATYDFAKEVIEKHLRERRFLANPKIYMVGDNIPSDIAGANNAGWESILVRTGVYDPSEDASIRLRKQHPPTHEVEDVEQAVLWAFERETGQ